MGTTKLNMETFTQTIPHEISDEERLNVAMELILSVQDKDLHHRVTAIADIAKNHGLKLTQKNMCLHKSYNGHSAQ
ncbi:MAG: hypothetical protein AAF701_01220 [Pseudomonadota bacterium]